MPTLLQTQELQAALQAEQQAVHEGSGETCRFPTCKATGQYCLFQNPQDTANATVGGIDPNEFKNLVQTVQDLALRVQALEK